MRIVAVAVLALLSALAAAGCGGEDQPEVAAAGGGATGSKLTAEAAPSPEPATAGVQGITVVGSGTAEAVPDVAEWSFGVQSEADSAAEALAETSRGTRRMLAALREAGIRKEDLRTEQVSVYPQTSDDGRTIVGYSASNTVHATVRSLARAGVLVDAAVAAGANQVYGPTLSLSDSTAQYRQAVDAAYDDARARAEAIAAKAGVQLGSALAIVEGGGGGTVYGYDRALADVAESVPVEPGQQEVAATLTVTFAIVSS
jgi:uncharacterized protein YggE